MQPIVTLIKDILIIIGLLVGVFLSIKLYLQFAPDILFRITPCWATPDIVILEIEIENKSRVKLTKEKILLKINTYDKSTTQQLGEWVDIFGAEEICKTTEIFYPGAVLRIDHLYRCTDDQILQGLIHFKAKFSTIEKLLGNIKGKHETWTNTFIVAR